MWLLAQSQQLVTNGVPQGSILCPIICSLFIKDLSVPSPDLCLTLNLGKSRYTWRNTHHLERPQQLECIIKPAKIAGDVTKINVRSCTWQRIIPISQIGWDWGAWGKSTGNALGVLQGSKTDRCLRLQPRQQNMSWAVLAGLIVSRSRDVLIPTFFTLVWLHQEYSVLFCFPPPVQEWYLKTG